MSQEHALPICLFPSAHWLLLLQSTPTLNRQETYLKQTYRNRYDILGVNGRLCLTVPVERQHGIKTPIKDIRIAGQTWRKQHISTLRSSYGRAAYFEHYFSALEACIAKPHVFLLDLNLAALEWLKMCGLPLAYDVIDAPWHFREGDHTYLWEPGQSWGQLPPYPQVFSDRHAFESGLSAIDLIMNKGPLTVDYLARATNSPVV